MSSEMRHEDGAVALNPDDVALNDIIDISAIDLNDQERWLLQCNHTYSKLDVNDIRTWLQPTFLDNGTNADCISNATKRLIDTRTWTRPKKRFSRLSFESIKEVTSPPQPLQSVKNDVWKLDNAKSSNSNSFNQQLEMDSDKNTEEMIPSMLRLSLPGSSNIGHTTTGHESLEAFLNMSQSNGIDSFINMEAPEFNETILANATRQSIMSTSSSSIYARDDNNHSINQTIGMADSQILTESMMHTSIFNDISEVNFSDAFGKDNVNVSVIGNANYNTDKFDKTITGNNDTFDFSTIKSNDKKATKKIDTTFTSNELSDALNSHSYIVNETFDTDSCESNHLSYIVIKETESKNDKYVESLDIVDEEETEVKNNATFDAGSSSSHESINSTLTLSPKHSDNSNKTSIDSVETLESLNTTYLANENESPRSIEINHKINKTYQTSPDPSHTFNTTFKSPLSINNQQLNSINSTFITETQLNETYDENVPSMPPPTNRYQTYRRNPMEMKKKSTQQLDTTYDQNFVAPNPPTMVNRYQTYRKNPTAISRIRSTNIIPQDDCPAVVDSQAKSMENLSGIKTNVQIPRKLHAPKNFSRLPQSLQKSNPNLTSSNALKIATIPTRISNFGFNRQRQIRNGDPSLTSKLYSVAKLSKCGSEQMLDGPTSNTDYLETGGSTESIESTQSAHSAPDLDDRLSICSDSSHSSYSRRTMNIDELHKIVRRQEESLKRNESMVDRRILENTWVSDQTNLPSPILKDSETLGSRGSSPGSIDSTVKTSSPILSPAESLQLLDTNADDHSAEDRTIIKPVETEQQRKSMMPRKPLRIPEPKSGIRQPVNRGTTAMSGIPRPASRIPAPRFSRANVKSHVEVKKNVF